MKRFLDAESQGEKVYMEVKSLTPLPFLRISVTLACNMIFSNYGRVGRHREETVEIL